MERGETGETTEADEAQRQQRRTEPEAARASNRRGRGSRGRHRPFAILMGATVVVLGLFAALYRVWGHAFVLGVLQDPESRWRGLLARVLRSNSEDTLVIADRVFAETLALLVGGAAVLAGLYVIVRLRPRWYVSLGLVLAIWLALETWAAPHLVFRFGLNHYELVRDPDHRPLGRSEAPGWNADGLRQDREAEEYAPEDFVVLILGDSFAQGYGLKPPHKAHVDAFPALVEHGLQTAFPNARILVANFGWTSASPLLEARRLADQGARYHPDLVCLFVDMTDPLDDIWYRNLFERRGLARLFDRLPLAIALLRRLAPTGYRRLYAWSVGDDQPWERYFHCEQPLELSRPFLVPLETNLQRCADVCRALGADFEVFVYPRSFQYTDVEAPLDREQENPFSQHSVLGPWAREPFRWFDELAQRVDYPVISLFDAFAETDVHPHCFEDDTHWNAAGHRIAADAILAHLVPELSRRFAQ